VSVVAVCACTCLANENAANKIIENLKSFFIKNAVRGVQIYKLYFILA
jgi:hypothetical protein